MRLGFVPALNPHAGGVFQYSATMLAALEEITKRSAWPSPVALLPSGVPDEQQRLVARGWRTASLAVPAGELRGSLSRLLGEGSHRDALRRLSRWTAKRSTESSVRENIDSFRRRDDLARWWSAQGIDLVLFPQPHPLAFEAGLPFVVVIHDLQHRLQPEFQEVSAGGEWMRREYILRNCVRHATRVLVESELGKEHVLFFYGSYGVRADRVDVLPMLPASTLPLDVSESQRAEMRARLGIPEPYLLYPAAFWPHKNHARIVQALEQLARVHQLRLPIVFCGARDGRDREPHYAFVMDMAAQCGVAGQIHVPGYVSDRDLAALYAGARALVMPTFFGPTNIPVLEAWALHCPVLTSDIPGIREQMGDAAVLVDPRDVEALAAGIERLWTDESLRRDLIARGARRLSQYTLAEYTQRLQETLSRAKSLLGAPAS